MFQRIFLAAFVLFAVALLSAQKPEESGPSKPLPPGPIQAKVKSVCTQCHNTNRITSQHLTRQQWSDKLDKMTDLGAYVPNSERKAFLDYLSKNFGPGKVAKIKGRASAR